MKTRYLLFVLLLLITLHNSVQQDEETIDGVAYSFIIIQ